MRLQARVCFKIARSSSAHGETTHSSLGRTRSPSTFLMSPPSISEQVVEANGFGRSQGILGRALTAGLLVGSCCLVGCLSFDSGQKVFRCDVSTGRDCDAGSAGGSENAGGGAGGGGGAGMDAGDPDGGCQGESDSELCSASGRCGAVSIVDRCGASRSVQCQPCACIPEPDAELCASWGKNCGTVDRPGRCGERRSVDCGVCSGAERCGGGGANVCGAPKCSVDGWCWVDPLPHGNGINALWFSDENDGWAAGAAGSLLRWNGTTWSWLEETFGYTLTAVWGASADDVWVMGEGASFHWFNQALHRDGTIGYVSSVHGSSGRDVWAVGSSGFIAHFDGGRWTVVVSRATGLKDLNGVWAVSPNDAWAVGRDGTLLHWNGTAWSQASGVPLSSFNAIWGSSAADVWAVGPSVVLHFDGSNWSRVNAPNADFRSVWGSGGSVWAGDGSGTVFRVQAGMWSAERTGTGLPVASIGGPQGGEPWIGGPAGVLQRRRGGSWYSEGRRLERTLNAVALSGNSAWAVGDWGAVWRLEGELWRQLPRPTLQDLHAVWAVSPSQVWIAGDRSILKYFDGAAWHPSNSPVADWRALWGFGANDVWAAGSEGAIAHWDGSAWQPAPGLTSEPLAALHGSAPADVWAVGAAGVILHWNGTDWSSLRPVTSKALTGVWAADAQHAWAVGAGGTILRWDGTAWSTVASPMPAVDLLAVSGSGPNDVWACGARNTFLHWDGTRWDSDDGYGFGGAARGLRVSPARSLAVGEGGALATWNGRYWVWLAYPGGHDLVGATPYGDGGVAAVGDDGFVGLWNGERWVDSRISTRPMRGAWARSDSEIWAVGDEGFAVRFDGGTWETVATPTTEDLYAVFGDAASLWAVGAAGTTLRFSGAWTKVTAPTAVTLYSVWLPAGGAPWAVGEGGHCAPLGWCAVAGELYRHHRNPQCPVGIRCQRSLCWGLAVQGAAVERRHLVDRLQRRFNPRSLGSRTHRRLGRGDGRLSVVASRPCEPEPLDLALARGAHRQRQRDWRHHRNSRRCHRHGGRQGSDAAAAVMGNVEALRS